MTYPLPKEILIQSLFEQEFTTKELAMIVRQVHRHLEKLGAETAKQDLTMHEVLKVADFIEEWFE